MMWFHCAHSAACRSAATEPLVTRTTKTCTRDPRDLRDSQHSPETYHRTSISPCAPLPSWPLTAADTRLLVPRTVKSVHRTWLTRQRPSPELTVITFKRIWFHRATYRHRRLERWVTHGYLSQEPRKGMRRTLSTRSEPFLGRLTSAFGFTMNTTLPWPTTARTHGYSSRGPLKRYAQDKG